MSKPENRWLRPRMMDDTDLQLLTTEFKNAKKRKIILNLEGELPAIRGKQSWLTARQCETLMRLAENDKNEILVSGNNEKLWPEGCFGEQEKDKSGIHFVNDPGSVNLIKAGIENSSDFVLFIGDHMADENLIRLVKGKNKFSFKVGISETSADYSFIEISDVFDFLKKLI